MVLLMTSAAPLETIVLPPSSAQAIGIDVVTTAPLRMFSWPVKLLPLSPESVTDRAADLVDRAAAVNVAAECSVVMPVSNSPVAVQLTVVWS